MYRTTVAFLFLLILLTTALGQSRPSQSSKQMTVAGVVRHSRDAVVQIVVSDRAGNEISLGSGFAVTADGKIVTNYHVIKGAYSGVAKLADGSLLPVEGVLAVDTDKDLTVLRVEGKGLPFLRLASIIDLHVGDHVVAIGSPLGLEGTVSDGIVSALRQETLGKDWIQTTAPVSPGNSGGPLLNMNGIVVGVITRQVSLEQGQNLNFAIPAEEVKSLLSKSSELMALSSIDEKRQHIAAWIERANALYEQGRYAEFIALCRQKCDGGDMSGCAELGWSYRQGEVVPQDNEKARSLFQRGCDGGFPYACWSLGDLYKDGVGVAKDDRQAFALYKKACDEGEKAACDTVGLCYEKGKGVAQDFGQAHLIYERSCANGNTASCVDLGAQYEDGRGAAQDDEKALALYKKACDGGDLEGCRDMGQLFVMSTDVAQDYGRAHAIFTKSCDEGDMPSCALLSNLYDRGLGVPRDREKALAIERKACEGGYQEACDYLSNLKR
jgi:TPR repeat protein